MVDDWLVVRSVPAVQLHTAAALQQSPDATHTHTQSDQLTGEAAAGRGGGGARLPDVGFRAAGPLQLVLHQVGVV